MPSGYGRHVEAETVTMVVMSERMERLIDELLKLAGGDPLLLERALREYGATERIPKEFTKSAERVLAARKAKLDNRPR